VTEMIDALPGTRNYYNNLVPMSPTGETTAQTAVSPRAAAAAKTQREFATIFYKEIMKQVFKAPNLSAEEPAEGDLLSSFNSDIMAEQMANQFVDQLLEQQQWLPAAGANQ